MIGSLTCSYLLSRFGRKQILQSGCVAGTVALLCISVGFFFKPKGDGSSTMSTVFILIGLALFMANFGLTLGPVIWLYIPEIVQPSLVGVATGVNWLGASITMILFPILQEAMPN